MTDNDLQERLTQARVGRKLMGLARLRRELPLFASECLKIKPKEVMDSPLVPLVFNRTQWHVHRAAEAQRAKLGRVRMLVGKGRKTTVSTYVAARGYHRAIFNRGVAVTIMAHEQATADELFEMVSRFHENSPVRPSTSLDNAKELVFDRLDSGIGVTTAGAKKTGRGGTPQILQWSEVAHSPNAQSHFAGIVQSVPDSVGSEVWLETTGAGPSGAFYDRWQDAEAGISDYVATFCPWYWTEEYTRAVDPGFTLDKEELEYQALHGLTLEQMAWRHYKIIDLKDPILFKQEYPATATEMFEASGRLSFIPPDVVLAARKANLDGVGPLVVGVDPARFGKDRFSVAWRRGRKVLKVDSRSKIGTPEALAWLKDIIDQTRPMKMFIDAGGGGDRLFDLLASWGEPYNKVCELVNFGGKPQSEVKVERDGTKRAGPANRRAEMWDRSKDWLEQVGGADIPDLDSLQADAIAPGFSYRTTDQCLVLESKEKIMARGGRSPDEWDAVALTFAAPVYDRPSPVRRHPVMQAGGDGGALTWMGV